MVACDGGLLVLLALPSLALDIALLLDLLRRHAAADRSRAYVACCHRHRTQDRILAHIHPRHHRSVIRDARSRSNLYPAVIDVLRVDRVMRMRIDGSIVADRGPVAQDDLAPVIQHYVLVDGAI